ncbi:MAG: hypothetical protein Q9226_003108 [Calogaya cf. arnoldii]
MVKDGHLAKSPHGINFEETASMGAGVTTVGQALYHNLKLPWPTKPTRTPFPILIYGGSTATGALAIQSCLAVLTTCSPKNFPFVKSLGADEVFDYRDPECGIQIRESTKNTLRYVFDCISIGSSYKIDAAALSSSSSSSNSQELHYLALLPTDSWPQERSDVNVR